MPVHSGHVMPNCARIALRMKSDLFGKSFRNRASSYSTLNATISDLFVFADGLRAMSEGPPGRWWCRPLYGPGPAWSRAGETANPERERGGYQR